MDGPAAIQPAEDQLHSGRGIPALLAHISPLGEADALVKVFACPQGELLIKARGLRRATSKLAAVLLPADELQLSLARGRADMPVLSGAHLQRAHAPWREDLQLLALYWLMLECACLGSANAALNKQVYTMVANLLRSNPVSTEARYGALAAFSAKLLHLHGQLLDLDHCCLDGHQLETAETAHLLPSGEGLIGLAVYNAQYARGAVGLLRLDPARRKRWQRLAHGPLLEYTVWGADETDAAAWLCLLCRRMEELGGPAVKSARFLTKSWRLASWSELTRP